jgi:predicted transcriptional regulator
MKNNFNEVFLAVKSQCEKQKQFAEVSNFDAIAKQADVPLHSLEMYFKHLHDIGLVRYSMEEKYVYLTTLGRRQAKLVK